MSFLPSDWPSFIWGIVVGALGLLFTGVLKKAGEDVYSAAKARLFPAPPQPIQVPHNFDPILYQAGSCSWVPEVYTYEREAQGYTYYPHPNGGAKCCRTGGARGSNEFLMVRPDAQPRNP